MEFDAKTAIIIGFFCKPEVKEANRKCFCYACAFRLPYDLSHASKHVLSYLPTLLEFFIGETLLTGSEISLP